MAVGRTGAALGGSGQYVGRFAPSPSGPLHFGSLVTAIASFLDARANGGRWLLRIEDLDPPRESSSAPRVIMEQLEAFGLHWDGEPLFQSTRHDAYRDALERLLKLGMTFPCRCSRRDYSGVYPGTCRDFDQLDETHAIRVLTRPVTIEFDDLYCGHQVFDLAREIGDFVIRRKDGLFAYQLAVIIDDSFQEVTHVIRGNDLLDSTPRQLYLLMLLDLPRPVYGHVPVIIGQDGHKLSKQAGALPVTTDNPSKLINQALLALGQQPVTSTEDPTLMLATATHQWQPGSLPRVQGVPLPPP